ncbi:hypothetical protein, partial [Yersinia enterocolitica]
NGMLVGNAEIVPFNPWRYLYHANLAYMRGNGLGKPVSLTRFGTDIRWLWMRLSVPERSNHPVGKDSKAKPPTHYNGLKNRFSITVRAGLSMNSQKSCLMMSCHFKLSVNMHFGY